AEVLERQDGDRRLVGQRQGNWGDGGRMVQGNAVGAHRTRDVLERLFAQVSEGDVEFAGCVFLNPRRDADATRFRQAFEPGRDVDPMAEDVLALDDDVALVDANTELDALVFGDGGVPLDHLALHRDRAGNRFDDARELDQQPVAGRLDDAALVLGDL